MAWGSTQEGPTNYKDRLPGDGTSVARRHMAEIHAQAASAKAHSLGIRGSANSSSNNGSHPNRNLRQCLLDSGRQGAVSECATGLAQACDGKVRVGGPHALSRSTSCTKQLGHNRGAAVTSRLPKRVQRLIWACFNACAPKHPEINHPPVITH